MQVTTTRRLALSTLVLRNCHASASSISRSRGTGLQPSNAAFMSMPYLTSHRCSNDDWIPLGLRRLEQRQSSRCNCSGSRGLSTMAASDESSSASVGSDSNSSSASSYPPIDPKSFDPLDESTPPLHPSQFYDANGLIPTPKALSPSAIMEFKACPQSYLFQYLFGIRQPTNEILAKGTFCHSALERLFDLEPSDRTLDNLHNLFREAWSEKRLSDGYKNLFDVVDEDYDDEEHKQRDVKAEIAWGQSSLALLDKYYKLEDPRTVPVPNPLVREIWVKSYLSDDDISSTFLVRGIVDRIDLIQGPYLRIVDYKTGKFPDLKYSPAVNERIANEKFYQLKIYALLLREMMKQQADANMQEEDELSVNGDGNDNNNGKSERNKSSGLPQNLRQGIPVRNLRLLYLTSKNEGPAKYLDMDLGATEDIRKAELDRIHADVASVWRDISDLVRTNDPRTFVHCDRSFCWCHKVRPRFMPETVWQKERPDGP